MCGFKSRASAWLAVLGLVLALVGLVVATGESLRHVEPIAPLSGAAETGQPASDSTSGEAYHPPGSSVWIAP